MVDIDKSSNPSKHIQRLYPQKHDRLRKEKHRQNRKRERAIFITAREDLL